MTPEEKAFELKKKFTDKLFNDVHRISKPMIKLCALIAVDEIIEAMDMFGYSGAMYDDFETGKIIMSDEKHPSDYWQKVKEEISKI